MPQQGGEDDGGVEEDGGVGVEEDGGVGVEGDGGVGVEEDGGGCVLAGPASR